MWGKLKFKVLKKVHISGLFHTILYKILLNFPKKSLKSLASNLQRFENHLTSENETKMKTKMDLRKESLKLQRSSMLRCIIAVCLKGVHSVSVFVKVQNTD